MPNDTAEEVTEKASEELTGGDAAPTVFTRVGKLYDGVEGLMWIGQLILRLSVGWMFYVSGKIWIDKLDAHANYFASLGFPRFMATVVVVIEMVGGLMLMAGVGTRVVAALLVGVMGGALMTQHYDTVSKSLDKLFYHQDFLLVLVLLVLVVLGPGKVSIDRFIRARLAPKK